MHRRILNRASLRSQSQMCLIKPAAATSLRRALWNWNLSVVVTLGNVLLASVAVAQNAPARSDLREAAKRAFVESQEKWKREWPQLKEQEWPALLATAGQSKWGIILSLRELRHKGEVAPSLRLLFQVKNVSDRPVRFWGSNYTP